MIIVNAIQYNREKNQKNNQLVKPIQLSKQNAKDGSVENSYQNLLHEAMMVYQR